MTDEERRAWIRMLAILLVAAGVRSVWNARPGAEADVGVVRDAVAALDTIDALAVDGARRSHPLGPAERLDPNRADEVELDRLPGVGPAMAAAIVTARSERPFTDASELLRVRGIGPATLARLEPHLRFSGVAAAQPRDVGAAIGPRGRVGAPPGASPVEARIHLNRADSATLQRLPGIGPALAARIAADRARNGAFRTVDELQRVPGIGPSTVERLRAHARTR